MAEEKEKKKKVDYSSAWAEARRIIWNARWRLAVGSVLLLVSRLSGMVLPASMKYVGDEVFTNRNYSLLKWIALVIGISTLIQGVTSFALSQILGVAAQLAITNMRMRVQRHIERLPISYFDSTQSGQLISRIMNDAEGIRNLVGTGLGQILGSLVTALIAIGVLFYLNWQLTAATMVVLLIFGAALMYAFKILRPVFRERNVITGEVTGRLGESLGGIRIVKAYTAEKREELSFARGAHRLFRNIAKSVTGVSAISSFSSVIIGAIAVVMIVIGGNAVQANTMTLGDFLMYISFTFLLAMPVIELTSIGTQITDALAGLDRIREVMAIKTEDEADAGKEPLEHVAGTIDFDNVDFEYDAGVPVLKQVSFHSEAGKTTALVGSSGSGKSTILSLVLNFIQPTSGRIKIDGNDLQSVKLRDYRRQLGVVLQDNFLFDGTFLKRPLPEVDADAISAEFETIATELESRATVLCHRDFHAANLMLDQAGQMRIIDHQDARIGSPTYDLVSLLLDRITEPPSREWLAEKRRYFLDMRTKFGLPRLDEEEFANEFRLQTIQRCLKAAGTFSFQSINRGKTYFIPFIVPMFRISCRAAESLGRFPAIREILGRQFD